MKKPKELSIKEQFKEAIKHIKDSSKFIYAGIIIFIASAFFGLFFRENLSFIEELLRQILRQTIGLNTSETVIFILQNNMQSSLNSIIFGFFVGMIPLFSTISNGVVIGYVLGRTYEISGGPLIWWRLLPHGIFELPAIFIAFGLGLRIGYGVLKDFTKYYWKKSKTLIFLPIVLGIISTIFIMISLASKITEDFSFNLTYDLQSYIYTLGVFLFSSLFYIGILAFITYIFNTKIRLIQNKHLKESYYNSLNVYLMIIIPLLIIAAIIEGILITLLG